jgi:hypothetical protein
MLFVLLSGVNKIKKNKYFFYFFIFKINFIKEINFFICKKIKKR